MSFVECWIFCKFHFSVCSKQIDLMKFIERDCGFWWPSLDFGCRNPSVFPKRGICASSFLIELKSEDIFGELLRTWDETSWVFGQNKEPALKTVHGHSQAQVLTRNVRLSRGVWFNWASCVNCYHNWPNVEAWFKSGTHQVIGTSLSWNGEEQSEELPIRHSALLNMRLVASISLTLLAVSAMDPQTGVYSCQKNSFVRKLTP